LSGVALACVAGRAEAADARFNLSIPQRSYADALIDLGLQTNISILGTASCGAGGVTSLRGRYTLDDALTRLLNGAPCVFRIMDNRTVRISVRPVATVAPAPAPMDPPRPPPLLAEVVVTATKRPVAMDRLPAGVSAISGQQIAATGSVDISRTVGQLAGVQTTNLGPGRDKLLIRGLSDGAFTGRTRSTVGTYLDEAPINYNAPDPDLRLVDLDRIEIIRGPQGALYGSGALAGVYRIVTRKPELEAMSAGVTGSVSATRGGDESYEVDGYINLPIVPGRIAARLVAYDDLQGGYLDNINLGIANVDQTRRNGGRLAFRAQISNAWRLDVAGATQKLHSNDTQYVTAASSTTTRPPAGTPPPTRTNSVREAHNNDFTYAGATIQGDFDWGSLTSSASYVHHVYSSQYDASATLAGNFVVRSSDIGAYFEAANADMYVQDLVLRSPGDQSFNWLFGAYIARTVEMTPSSLKILSVGPQVTTAYTENRKDRREEYALYGEGSYEFATGWSATIGGRLFENRVRTTSDVAVTPPYDSRSFDRTRTFQGFSPKIALQKEFRSGDLIYALVSEGYRSGGFNSSGLFAIAARRATFAPDRLRNYEIGAKLRRLNNRLNVRASAYINDWSNIQTDQYRPSGLAYTANVADARIVGLEAEASYDWPFGLSLQINGLLVESRIRNANADFAAQVTGDLPGVPKTSGGILAVYQGTLNDQLTLRLIGEASYVGASSLSFNASLSPKMGQYLRARLSAEIATENWRATAFVNNPFNDTGDTFAYGNPFSFGQVRQVTPQRPRTVGIRLAATF
jgi:iron complex outermembrane recepter protein